MVKYAISQRWNLMLKKLLVACAASLLLSGCFKPTPEQLANPDFGPYPFDYKETIQAYLAQEQPDPESNKYRYLGEPIQAYDGFLGRRFGYAVCVVINAKNIYGGYDGQVLWMFMLRGDKVITSDKTTNPARNNTMASMKCERLGLRI